MGLLDSIIGSAMGGGQQGGGNPLMQLAMQMLMKQGGGQQGGAGGLGGLGGMLGSVLGGGGNQAPAQTQAAPDVGGLGGILEAFQKGGLGHLADSWVGTGENLPVNGDQVSEVFGQDKIAQMANQLGMSHGDVSGGLAKMLPELINHVTPNGQVPQDHNMIQDALGMLFKK
jgi:uncharacterized protein YidB (DUF937 family)